jgi:outer membrane protein assembly factor BamA
MKTVPTWIARILQSGLVLFYFLIVMNGCTGLGHLSEGQYLVKDYQLELSEKDEIYHYKKVKDELADEIKLKPNGKFLWMRPGLALYNTISEPKKDKGIKYWLKYKLGSPPVLLDETYCNQLNTTFENRLYHKGHFNASSTVIVTQSGKTADVTFEVEAHDAYLIDTLMLPEKEDTIGQKIHSIMDKTLINKGDPYNLETLKNERTRIEDELKNMGFYYFEQDYIKFLADTANGDNKVKLKLEIKDEVPEQGKEIFRIDNIYVAEDMRLENYAPDTTLIDGYQVISATNYMKEKYFLNSILYQRDSLYSKRHHNNSIKQLMGLRAYKYVTARYAPSPTHDNMLDVNYIMNPAQKMSLSAELNAVSKSNSFSGPGIKLTFNSKNFFRGAELFSVNFGGRFEKQLNGEGQGDTAYEVSVDANLDIPRLMPFKLKKRDHPYLPNSNIVLGTGLFARVSLYKFSTYTTGLSYSWRKNESITHILKPIDISITNLLEATDEFKEFLEFNPSIRKSFEEQFILGMSYNFIINKLPPTNPSQYYFNIGVDPSGNLASLLSGWLGAKKQDSENAATVFGQPVSQYFRIRTDLRYYFKTGKESIIATRLYTGVGVPYGNSEVMPYVKQFYAGGTNSMRAFRARSLGPGSYIPPVDQENVLVDQTGEIRLETNIEYRFPIAGFLKGALFSDIGNIWLVNEDTLRPGGKFQFDTFHKQIAIGTGFGLRVDVDLMVLRLDWAFPIRKPWLPEGERWAIKEIDLFDKNWRKDNLIWNISIGYPF